MKSVPIEDLATQLEPTGWHDRHGIPICRGDLIRVPHYVHCRNRRQMWLYFRVAKLHDRWVVQNWNDLDASKWQCLLEHCGIGGTEVLAEAGLQKSGFGAAITFNERLRLAVAQYQQGERP